MCLWRGRPRHRRLEGVFMNKSQRGRAPRQSPLQEGKNGALPLISAPQVEDFSSRHHPKVGDSSCSFARFALPGGGRENRGEEGRSTETGRGSGRGRFLLDDRCLVCASGLQKPGVWVFDLCFLGFVLHEVQYAAEKDENNAKPPSCALPVFTRPPGPAEYWPAKWLWKG